MKRLAPLFLLAASGCHIGFDRGIVVDGVRLEQKHEEVLDLTEWSSTGLEIESHQGDIRIEPTAGATSITLEVYEENLGDARAAYENGVLVARTKSGRPCAIGDVLVRTAGPIPRLEISTGMGDVTLRDVAVQEVLRVVTGMGDIEASGPGVPREIELESGMGSVELENARCTRLRAKSGMGDLDLAGITAADAEISSGMGDVELRNSTFEQVKASTGMGDVDCVESSYVNGNFETGLGDVND